MRQSSTWLRYTIALFALLAGLILSIRWSERGVLLESPSATALSSTTSANADWDLESMRVFNQVLLQVRANYVEPERVDPRRMLVHALDRVQNFAPEIVALFNDELEASPTEVEVTVGTTSQEFDLSDVESHWQLSFKLREILSFIDKHIDKKNNDLQELEYAAANGMLSTLDPHSALLAPDLFKEMQASNRGSFGGLGIVISIRDDQLTVISPIANTPAGRAGFKTGDRIIKVNDESTINMPLDEAVSRLRGAPGSKITLQISRDGWSEPHEFKLKREVINIESVKHEQLGNGIGYISIQNFQGNTHSDLLSALSDLRKNGDINGLILDLRNDPGGLLQQAILVSDTFLSEGTITTTVGVGSQLREQSSATAANTEPNYPIVVLTNAGTASASEIVAGAIKSHDRGIVVGDVTFGKGSVQNIYPFRDGSALKLTIAQYLTPGDVSIQGVGVMPDIHLVPATVTDDMIDLYPPDYVARESALEASLTNERIPENREKPSSIVRYYRKAEETDAAHIEDPNEFKIDFEIGFAESLLRASTPNTYKRPAMLNKVKPSIDRAIEEQSLIIQEQLRQLNVDWASGPTVRQPLEVDISTKHSGNRVNAGDTITVTAKVTNKGDEPLYRVRATSRSDYNLLDDREFVFGHIPPGESRTWSIDVEVPNEAPSRIDEIALSMWSDTVDLEHTETAKIRVHGLERPHWGFSGWIDDTENGNGDGMLQVGETVKLHLLIRNIGAGDAGETVSYIRNRSDSSVFIHKGREAVDKLAAGDSMISTFEFTVQKRPEDGIVKLDAEVLDTEFREFVSESLELPIRDGDEAVEIESAEGVAKITANSTPIYATPSDQNTPLAEARRGTTLAVEAKTPGWYRVRWDDNRIGWLPEAGAKLQSRGNIRGDVTSHLQYQPPMIDLEQNILEVSTDTFNLRGIVADETKVQNYYVLVNSRVAPYRRQTTKRAYRSVDAATSTINVNVPLMPGSNEIIVVAQDDENVSSTARIHVYRNGE